METHIDEFGRVVIPKQMRDHLGLKAGATLAIEEHEQKILLKPMREVPSLTLKDGVLVFGGKALGDLKEVVRTHRESRVRHITSGANP